MYPSDCFLNCRFNLSYIALFTYPCKSTGYYFLARLRIADPGAFFTLAFADELSKDYQTWSADITDEVHGFCFWAYLLEYRVPGSPWWYYSTAYYLALVSSNSSIPIRSSELNYCEVYNCTMGTLSLNTYFWNSKKLQSLEFGMPKFAMIIIITLKKGVLYLFFTLLGF